ncbi:MAG: prenyltransferase [Smithella sp.]|nr:prenyltransferase [Smithella sp.]HOU50387.1 prenyltransferase [Smithella sp.]HQH17359.1 prenyltransferase [Smithella sp.]HQI73010.1 prenyltransferase [Smithella sp.]
MDNHSALVEERGILELLQVWWLAFRYHFVPSSFLPAILGVIVAWSQTGFMNQWFFFLTALGVTLNHVALNMTDDYFDYHAAVDRFDQREGNPYAGGSGVLTSGKIQHHQMRLVFTVFYLLTILIGLYLCVVQTWWVLAFGVFGMASSYFYTAPPLRYGYRGFGEISQLINFSLTIGLGAYVVQTVSFSWEAFWVLLPLGFMMFAMIIINEIPDSKDDAAAGKCTLVARFGSKKAVWLYGLAMMAAYAIILFAPLWDMATPWIYLTLPILPWTIQAFRILKKNFSEPVKLAPANLLTIRVHHLTGILFIIAYLIQGLQNGRDFQQAFFAVFTLTAFYLPAAVFVLFKNNNSQQPNDRTG